MALKKAVYKGAIFISGFLVLWFALLRLVVYFTPLVLYHGFGFFVGDLDSPSGILLPAAAAAFFTGLLIFRIFWKFRKALRPQWPWLVGLGIVMAASPEWFTPLYGLWLKPRMRQLRQKIGNLTYDSLYIATAPDSENAFFALSDFTRPAKAFLDDHPDLRWNFREFKTVLEIRDRTLPYRQDAIQQFEAITKKRYIRSPINWENPSSPDLLTTPLFPEGVFGNHLYVMSAILMSDALDGFQRGDVERTRRDLLLLRDFARILTTSPSLELDFTAFWAILMGLETLRWMMETDPMKALALEDALDSVETFLWRYPWILPHPYVRYEGKVLHLPGGFKEILFFLRLAEDILHRPDLAEAILSSIITNRWNYPGKEELRGGVWLWPPLASAVILDMNLRCFPEGKEKGEFLKRENHAHFMRMLDACKDLPGVALWRVAQGEIKQLLELAVLRTAWEVAAYRQKYGRFPEQLPETVPEIFRTLVVYRPSRDSAEIRSGGWGRVRIVLKR